MTSARIPLKSNANLHSNLLRQLLIPLLLVLGISTSNADTSELFISEYIEGSSLNKAIEIYNGTGGSIDLAAGVYTLELYSNGSATASQTVALTGILADGDVFVVAHASAAAAVLAETDLQSSAVANFNGDDGVVLRKNGAVIDAFGQNAVDPGSQWPGGSQNDTLNRKVDVCAGDTDFSDAFDASVEWDVSAQDTFTDLGSHTANCGGGVTGPIAWDMVASTSQNLSSYTNIWTDAFTSPADGFQKYQRGVSSSIPFDVLDDSLSFPTDGIGIIKSTNTDVFFGVADTVNGDNPTDPAVATWVFDVTGAGALELSIDMGAMGNFESTDFFEFTYSIDGGPTLSAFASTEDDSGSNVYIMESGNNIPLDDTLLMQGTILTNDLTTFTTALVGSGNALTVTLNQVQNASSEAVAFQNMIVTAVEPDAGPKINEFLANHTGSDAVEYIEVFGASSTDYSAYTLLEIEGDSSSNEGTIDGVFSVGTTDANGVYLASLAANDLENGSITLLLVKDFTGSLGTDMDVDDDGVIDDAASLWDSIQDSVAVSDGGGSDLHYSSTILAANYDGLPFTPGGASRIPDGFDTDASSDWVRNDFDGAGIPSLDPGSPVVGEAYNTPGETNELVVAPPEACGDDVVLISAIQGDGPLSFMDGQLVSIEGIVVGDFQDGAFGTHGDLNGFYVQEEDADNDGDPLTSEGIFVYDGFSPALDVSMGDKVRVSGTVDEFNDLTEITNTTFIANCNIGNPPLILPAVTEITLPVSSVDDFEAYEGMYVTLPQELTIIEYFNFDRFGVFTLSPYRQPSPTAIFDPGSLDYETLALANSLNRIDVDDGRSSQNPDPAIHPNGAVFDLDNLFRGGDLVQNVTGVMDGFDDYSIQPTQGADYTAVNLRTSEPDDVGGSFKVASYNVLNYFNGDGLGGGFPTSRGADDLNEFDRQRDKIIAAMVAIDADVYGLMEIENDGYATTSAIQDLVNGLNDATAAGTYDFIDPGVATIGDDEIAVGLIYNTWTTTPQGNAAILDSSVDPLFNDDRNRPALAQTFIHNLTTNALTVAVNHLKSKGSDCDGLGDPDLDDGAGNCNITRANAATALANWLLTDPTASNDDDFLIIGDLNAYDKEDPIDNLLAAGYTDLAFIFGGEEAYSYSFNGQAGYLDYALANPALLGQVSGAAYWHINSDEPDLIDYDTSFKQAAQDAIYAPDAYRSSDHDPAIVGIAFRYDNDAAGFLPPIKNQPEFNKGFSNSTLDLPFSLSGDFGLDILEEGYPRSQRISCRRRARPFGPMVPTVPGAAGLSYDSNTGAYTYSWQTGSYTGTCRQFIMKLKDGSTHYAYFQFE